MLSDPRLPKGQQKNLHITGKDRRKKKKREREKGVRTGPAPWEGAVKEDRFLHTGKATHWQRDQLGEGEFQSLRGIGSNQFAEDKLGKDCKVCWCHHAHPSQGHWTSEVGRNRVPRFRLWKPDPGRVLGLAVRKKPEIARM